MRVDGDESKSNFTREKTLKIISSKNDEKERETAEQMDTKELGERLMNNLKRENTFKM